MKFRYNQRYYNTGVALGPLSELRDLQSLSVTVPWPFSVRGIAPLVDKCVAVDVNREL